MPSTPIASLLPLLLASLLLAPSTPGAAEPAPKKVLNVDVRKGLWEVTVVADGQAPRVEAGGCQDEDFDIAAEEFDEDSGCQTSRTLVGKTLTMRRSCFLAETGVRSETIVELTYSRDSYKGTTVQKMTDRSGKVTVQKASMSGRWLRECKPGDK
jgi:hypothetical protein